MNSLNLRTLSLCAAGALTLLTTVSGIAQSGMPAPIVPITPDSRLATIHASISHTRNPSSVAISPDGKLLAWSVGGKEGLTLHLTTLADPDPSKDRIITPGSATNCSNSASTWSPDSQTLAFTSSCTSKQEKPGQPQIFLWARPTGTVTQLTHLQGIFQQAVFTPDGRYLSFLFVENATRSAGALAAMKPWSGVIGEDGVEIQRVALVSADPAAPSTVTFLTPATLHVYEFAWSITAPEITFVAANPPGENNWWVAKLYTQAHGQLPKVVFDPNTTRTALHGLQIAVPRFSSDGKQIAFIGGLMSDQGSTGGDIWTIPATGGEATDVTPNIDGTPTWLAWNAKSTSGNDTLTFSEDRSGHSLLTVWNVGTKSKVDSNDLGETNVTGGPIKMAVSISSRGQLAFVKSGHNLAPEIVSGPYDALRQVTHLNNGVKSPAHTESIEWTNDKFNVQGWLTYPKDYDATRKYPMIVTVHGGPSASASASFAGSLWAELGYFVFAPNPRGSFGQGEAFTAANRKDFGYGDLRDILAGMDTVEKKVSVDKSREGLMGWSYGGFMTMFGVTQTHRFRAAVAGAGVADWLSYYGENSIDQWMVPFFEATVYDDPAVYAKSSAITFIKNVKTPTLVVVGDRDGECPAPQSFEFWHALRAEGVKTQLVVYPNEGHHFVNPANVSDLEAREVDWFTKNMPANEPASH